MVYVHVGFSGTSAECLAGLSDTWPKDGILRVEVSPYNSTHPEWLESNQPYANTTLADNLRSEKLLSSSLMYFGPMTKTDMYKYNLDTELNNNKTG